MNDILNDILEVCGGKDALIDWINRDGCAWVSYLLWDDDFCGVYSEDEIFDVIEKLV